MKHILLILLAVASNAYGFECNKPDVGIHVHTHHVNRSAHFNENNAGYYFRCENGFTAGGYNNSENGKSAYVGYDYRIGYLNVTVGMMQGYTIEPFAIVIPSIRIPKTPIRIAYLPQSPYAEKNTRGWHFMLENSF